MWLKEEFQRRPGESLDEFKERLKAAESTAVSYSADALSQRELATARLMPLSLVEHYLYQDFAVLAGPGGTSKTTLKLWEIVHIALGRHLYHLRTESSTTVFVTGEDNRERIAARLREIMTGMDLSKEDRDVCLERIRVLDLVGRRFRLCELDRNGNIKTSADVDRFIESVAPLNPGFVVFDPLASFGAPEETVNTAAQGAVNAARRIVREIGCCVRVVRTTPAKRHYEKTSQISMRREAEALYRMGPAWLPCLGERTTTVHSQKKMEFSCWYAQRTTIVDPSRASF